MTFDFFKGLSSALVNKEEMLASFVFSGYVSGNNLVFLPVVANSLPEYRILGW
jgi:hypothetical protein